MHCTDADEAGEDPGRTVAGGYSCTTELTCTAAPDGLVLAGEEFDRLEGNCMAQEARWEAPGDCGAAEAFAYCEEDERVVAYMLVEAGQTLRSLEERCARRGGTWSLDGDNPPVAELSVDDIELVDVSSKLAGELIPSSELRAYCEGAENQFGIAVTENSATGFTRYHYFACIDEESYRNLNHFTQLLRDSYESVEDVPSPGTNVAAIRIGDRLFLTADNACFNCTYDFAGSSGTLLTVTDFELIDSVPHATVRDGAGNETLIALTQVTL
jgi:hypothetical protein